MTGNRHSKSTFSSRRPRCAARRRDYEDDGIGVAPEYEHESHLDFEADFALDLLELGDDEPGTYTTDGEAIPVFTGRWASTDWWSVDAAGDRDRFCLSSGSRLA